MGYGYTVFKLAPLGDMLLTVNPVDPVYVRLWNLDTRQCVRTIPIPLSSDDQETDHICDAFFFDDLVVTCTAYTISVWSENGELVHQYIPDLIHGITPLATHHENIIFAYTEERRHILKGARIGWFDVRSGTVTRDFLPSAFRERIQGLRPNVLSIFVCDNRWLVVQVRDNAMNTHQLYVFDGDDNFSQVHDYTFNCAYARIQHSPENGTTFIARQSTRSGVDVFHLVEGRVTLRFSFPVDPAMADARAFRDSAFLQHLFPRNHPELVAYNTATGEMERSYFWHPSLPLLARSVADRLDRPLPDISVSETRQELYRGLGANADNSLVVAFLLKEPCD
jgi:hypothetical protein